MTDIALRDLRPDDVERLVEIALAAWQPVADGTRQQLGDEIYGRTRPDWRASKAAQIRGVCAPDPRGRVLVAECGGVVAGFVTWFPGRPVDGAAEIGNNAVHPDFQGRGIAQTMYRAVFERLRAEGIDIVKVVTGGDDAHAPARAAYERVGFDRSLPVVEYYRTL